MQLKSLPLIFDLIHAMHYLKKLFNQIEILYTTFLELELLVC